MGGYKLDDIWTIDHIWNAQTCMKEEVFDYLIMSTKMTLLASLAIVLCEVVLYQHNSSVKVSHEICFTFSGTFYFHILLLSTGVSE